MDVRGGLVEWLCSGLQIRQRRFDSDLSLNEGKCNKNQLEYNY